MNTNSNTGMLPQYAPTSQCYRVNKHTKGMLNKGSITVPFTAGFKWNPLVYNDPLNFKVRLMHITEKSHASQMILINRLIFLI